MLRTAVLLCVKWYLHCIFSIVCLQGSFEIRSVRNVPKELYNEGNVKR